MKKLIQTGLFLSLALNSIFVFAGEPAATAPEIGMGSAALGFGLLAGIVALISEKRRK